MARGIRKEARRVRPTLQQAIRVITRTHLDLTALIGSWDDDLTAAQRAAITPIRNRLSRFLVQSTWDGDDP